MTTASISDSVYIRIGKSLDVDPAAIKAVALVESAGRGMLADGRPAILFEAHIFANQTGGKYNTTHPTISSPVWNRELYKGGAGEWPRLAEARALDEEAANASASWGIFQIMGFNYKACGFLSATQYAEAMMTGPAAHVDAFANFIAANKSMLTALRAKDWTTFARLYNGPGQVPYYSAKIAESYAQYAGKLVDVTVPSISPLVPQPTPVLPPPPPPAQPSEGPPIPYVDVATPAKPVIQSQTVIGGGIAGTALAGTVVDNVLQYITTAQTATDGAIAVKTSLGALIGFKYLPIVLGVIALVAVGYIVFRYVRKVRAGDVIVR